jgi:AraC-like DNA-binding protein
MPSSGTTKFTDAEGYKASIRGAKFDLVFGCEKDFEARLTSIELRHLYLLRGQESLPRLAHFSLMPGLVSVTFPIGHDSPQICDGVKLQPGDFVLHSLGQHVHQRTCGPSQWGSISLAPKHLATFGKALAGIDLVAPPVARILRPVRVDAVRLLHLHAQACRLAETKPKMIAHPEVARALEQDLIHTLVNCLTTDNVYQYGSPKEHHMKVIARFEEIVAAHPERQLQIPKLCREIGVSERTLRTCCTEFLGMSPNRYGRMLRLNLVRAALRWGNSQTATVGGIARSCGFSELGRFAANYRSVFGEAPSTTLRRKKIIHP